MSIKVRVGFLTVREPREVTEHYECAAWHQTIRVAPGRYEVFAFLEPGDIRERYIRSFYVPVSGPITSACFVARLGASYGRDEGPSKVGKLADGTIRLSTYAREGEENPDLELDESVVERFEYDTSYGWRQVSYRLSPAWVEAFTLDLAIKRCRKHLSPRDMATAILQATHEGADLDSLDSIPVERTLNGKGLSDGLLDHLCRIYVARVEKVSA